jgi:hypothetical protein
MRSLARRLLPILGVGLLAACDHVFPFSGQEDWCAEPITSTVGNGDCRVWETPPHRSDLPAFGYVMIR